MHKRSIVRREERIRGGDFRSPNALEQDFLCVGFDELRRVYLLRQRSQNIARTQAVDTNPIFAQLDGDSLCQQQHAAFGRIVMRVFVFA